MCSKACLYCGLLCAVKQGAGRPTFALKLDNLTCTRAFFELQSPAQSCEQGRKLRSRVRVGRRREGRRENWCVFTGWGKV